jgi:hypothetical protein
MEKTKLFAGKYPGLRRVQSTIDGIVTARTGVRALCVMRLLSAAGVKPVVREDSPRRIEATHAGNPDQAIPTACVFTKIYGRRFLSHRLCRRN